MGYLFTGFLRRRLLKPTCNLFYSAQETPTNRSILVVRKLLSPSEPQLSHFSNGHSHLWAHLRKLGAFELGHEHRSAALPQLQWLPGTNILRKLQSLLLCHSPLKWHPKIRSYGLFRVRTFLWFPMLSLRKGKSREVNDLTRVTQHPRGGSSLPSSLSSVLFMMPYSLSQVSFPEHFL